MLASSFLFKGEIEMKRHTSAWAFVMTAYAALAIPQAYAHHPMGGGVPGNAIEGLLSGLGHPVIGFDHFLFVLAMGAACYYFGRKAGTIVTFIAATVLGTVLHLYKTTLAYPDLWVALSLVVLGAMLFGAHRLLQSRAALGFFALSGIAHGYAYGESIVGAEPTPLFAYLTGFTAIQLAIAFGGFLIARYVSVRKPSFPGLKALGGALAAAGAGFVLLSLA